MPVIYVHILNEVRKNSRLQACVVDRTRAEAPSPIPIVASALKLDLPNYAPEECPICKEGKLPLVHLGSRKMKEAAKQTL